MLTVSRVTAALAALAVALVAGCSGGTAARQARTTASQVDCGLFQRLFPSTTRLPGYTLMVNFRQAVLPIQSLPGHPLPFENRYACGQFRGFIISLALSGSYRQQDNARARALGYTIGKWPLVPLTGAIVRQQAHRVLEIYEGIYEFSSPAAAAAFLRAESGGAQAHIIAGLGRSMEAHRLPVSMAPGVQVTERLLGPLPAIDERAIYVGLRMSSYAITLSFQGGQSLGWRDVIPYWNTVWSRLSAIGDEHD